MRSLRLSQPFDDGAVVVPEDGQCVVLRAQLPLPAEFPKDRTICVQSFQPTVAELQASGWQVQSEVPQTAALAVVQIIRSREETLGLVAAAWTMLPSGGTLLVDGQREDGIDGIFKRLRTALPVAGQEARDHGRVIWLTRDDTPAPAGWDGTLGPRAGDHGFVTAAGVFSADGPDPGSVELAGVLDGALAGEGADLGAGWGWLAQAALAQNPRITRLDLIEAEGRALECARSNVKDPRAQFLWADATRHGGGYDFVISNPPFHAGRKPDPSLGRAFIAAAARMLTPSGTLWLVANRQLAYESTLDEAFTIWETLSQSNRFKVIRARKPRAGKTRSR